MQKVVALMQIILFNIYLYNRQQSMKGCAGVPQESSEPLLFIMFANDFMAMENCYL